MRWIAAKSTGLRRLGGAGGPVAPVNTALPAITGAGGLNREGVVQTVSTGSWDVTPDSYIYRWFLTLEGAYAPPQTNSTYTPTYNDAVRSEGTGGGDTLACGVIAVKDGIESIEAIATPVVITQAADPYWVSNTKIMLPFDGTDGATTTVERADARAVTFVGTAQIDTAQFKFGVSSLMLDGNSDYVTLADAADLDMGGAKSFTFEGWMRPRSFTSQGALYSKKGVAFGECVGRIHTTGTWRFFGTTGGGVNTGVLVGTTVMSANTWYYLSMTRDHTTSTWRIYLNGVLENSAVDGNNPGLTTYVAQIGASPSSSYFFDGHIDDFRFTSGVARYTGATHDVPQMAHPLY